MPLTPRFSLAQDEDQILLTVRVPYVRVGDAELVIDGAELTFYCAPYLLRLTLPGGLVDDERVRSTYDADDAHGTLTIAVPKAQPGETFPDLDLVTRLLPRPAAPPAAGGAGAGAGAVVDLSHIQWRAPDAEQDGADDGGVESAARGFGALALDPPLGRAAATAAARTRGPPLIEVIGSSDEPTGRARASSGGTLRSSLAPAAAPARGLPSDSARAEEGAPLDSAPRPPAAAVLLSPQPPPPRYGFLRRFAGVFGGLREELPEAVELPDPDGTPAAARRALREADEDARFDAVRYACDNSADVAEGDPAYAEAMGMAPWWEQPQSQPQPQPGGRDEADGGSGAAAVDGGAWAWRDDEVEAMRALPRREYLIDGTLVGGAAAVAAAAASSPDSADTAAAAAPLGEEAARILASLVPLLAAYCYDHLTTGGEPTCESAWTLATLTPALSWLDDDATAPSLDDVAAALAAEAAPDAADTSASANASASLAPSAAAAGHRAQQPHDNDEGVGGAAAAAAGAPSTAAARAPTAAAADAAVRFAAGAFQRRVLCCPYLRRWDLGLRALGGAARLLAGGRRPVLRALLAARHVLRGDEQRYLLCTLLLDDLCVWAQAAPAAWLAAAAHALAGVRLAKSDAEFAGWQLERIDREGPEAVAVDGEGDEEAAINIVEAAE